MRTIRLHKIRVRRNAEKASACPSVFLVLLLFILWSSLVGYPSQARAEEVFITIGAGDFAGVYFPTGLAIAKILNEKRDQYGIRATVESTSGSRFNLDAISAGYMEFGLAQADTQYQAVKGLGDWSSKGPQQELRAVLSIYHESVTLVAATDSGITTVEELRGKRVSLGMPGSGQHRLNMKILQAVGLDPETDVLSQITSASAAPSLLQDRVIDAYFFTVGHPSETIRKGLSSARKAHIVPIVGPQIDKIVSSAPYYSNITLDLQALYPGIADQTGKVQTFGVMATLCTSARVDKDTVYVVTKEIFENLDFLRKQHPALQNINKDQMLTGLTAPFHPGALRYYREVGLLP